MKAKPCKIVSEICYVQCSLEEATHIELNIPGPTGILILPVMLRGTRKNTNNWTWNGSIEAPTLKPSILTTGHNFRAHSFITDGKINFLSDSDNEFANKTFDLLDVE